VKEIFQLIGRKLGCYQVISHLGKGGMGEVYLAHDTKLNRDIALKVLPSEFARNPERMGRFKREAQLLASLNHTNIAGIYGLEECEGVNALVMELAEGETLAERISKHPIALNEALSIARQIIEALEAAHDKGIIHRDLKPANIKVTPEGTVKVLDFGLAKALEGEVAEANLSESPTLSMAATNAGIILGTAAYMAPEQARGSGVDRRCDIWSFGVVLFEMLACKRLFSGETISDTLAAVLRADIDWDMLPKGIPAKIQALLHRCLTRDRKQRLQAIGEARIAIEEYVANPVTPAELPAEMPVMRFEISIPPMTDPISFALSNDGLLLAFVGISEGQQKLWLRPLDQLTALPLAGTEGAVHPFWSPDSRAIGFFAEGKLKRINIAGGAPQILADALHGTGGSWNREDVIVFAPAIGSALLRVPATGGNPVPVTHLDSPLQMQHAFPHFLPDGRHILFSSLGTESGIYLGSLDSPELRRVIVAETAAYALPGYLLYTRQGTLFAQRFNPESGDLSGDVLQVADSLESATSFGMGRFSISDTGILAYQKSAGLDLRQLAWFDRSGKEISRIGTPDSHNLRYPELSPDGLIVATCRAVHGNSDIWLSETARGVPVRFTFARFSVNPVWSPDGNWIAFSSVNNAVPNIYRKASSGTAGEELLRDSPLNEFPLHWSPDGKTLLFARMDAKTGIDLWALPLEGEREPFPFVKTNFESDNGQFSPNGRGVAYQCNESGRVEVYVQPFPDPGGKWMISTGGGIAPRWRRDGKELFYIAPDGKLMAVTIRDTGQTLKAGAPVALFQTRIVFGGTTVRQKHQYAVAPTGRRFLINISADESKVLPITVVTNWPNTLKQ
jgi:serine/threonine protein kinase/Tol biopolymer transport system component